MPNVVPIRHVLLLPYDHCIWRDARFWGKVGILEKSVLIASFA
jgi:hypothetical protein